jgi:TRAP-type uncharacterized transport system substrate-binding protein
MKKTSTAIVQKLTSAAFTLCIATLVQAQDAKPDCALRVASGPAGKIYELVVKDIQAVCGATAPVCAIPSSGGLQNLNLLSASEAELGIVQVDTLKEMKDGDENIKQLQVVMPLHNNLLHVISLAQGSLVNASYIKGVAVPMTGNTINVRKFSELKGMTVGVVGSAQHMGQALEKQLGYGMKFVIADNDDHAISMLKSGQIQAVFTLGGWPLPSIARIKNNVGLQLVDYDLKPQLPYVSVKRNYQNLDAFNLNFLGIPNLLATRPFKSGGAMAGKVANLQNCIRQHLDELQEGRYQPIWKEIKDSTASLGIAPFSNWKSASASSK